MDNIVLIGMPGTGKSTVGQALAARLDYGFVDVDDLIVEAAGKTLPDILRQDGLETFYKIENQVGRELEWTHTVIATGGSMVLYPEAMAHLKEGSVVVWLQTPFDEIQKRMPKDLYDRGIAAPRGCRCGKFMRSAVGCTQNMPTSSWPAGRARTIPPNW